ncbi:MAG TPA: hypothetical protein VJ464_26525 [Blastocatellia bacterium]|nr:hypothetical protein [Blastocatellia bacterium]
MLQKNRHRIRERNGFFCRRRGRLLPGTEQLAEGAVEALQSRLRRFVLCQNGRRCEGEQKQAGEASHLAARLPSAASRAAEAFQPKYRIAPLTETAQRIVRASRHPFTFTFIGWLSDCSLRECD